MSELSIEALEHNEDMEAFEEMHFHTTMNNVKELCIKHGTDNIIENIKEYLSLELDK